MIVSNLKTIHFFGVGHNSQLAALWNVHEIASSGAGSYFQEKSAIAVQREKPVQ